MPEIESEIGVPAPTGLDLGTNSESPGFQPLVLLVLVVIVVLVAVQNIWLRRRAEAENRKPDAKADDYD